MLKGKNSEYKRQVILLMVVGILFYYIQCTISGTMLNVLTEDACAVTGWAMTDITGPIAISSIIGIFISFIMTTMLYKMNPKIVSGVVIFILAITMALMGLSVATVNYKLFYVVFFIARLIYALPATAMSAFLGNWFLKTRGTALGIVTIGAPLSSATFVLLAQLGTRNIGFANTWYIFAAFIAVVGIITLVFLKKSPTEIGLYVDGETQPTKVEEASETSRFSFKEMISNPDGWLSSIGFALLTFVLVCLASFYVVMLTIKGITPAVFAIAMVVSSVGGIPISFLLGKIDDRFGTIAASIVLCIVCALGPIGLMFADKGMFFVAISVVGFAAMSGGIPNLQPSMNYHVYGKNQFLQTYRYTFIPSSILSAFAAGFMAAFIESGKIDVALIVIEVLCLVPIVLFAIIGRRPSYDKRNEA